MADDVRRVPLVTPWPSSWLTPPPPVRQDVADEEARAALERLTSRRAELARRTAAVELARTEGRERPRTT